MKPAPKKGQVLYSLNVGNAARQEIAQAMHCIETGNAPRRGIAQALTPVKVVSVGRKYFTCRPDGGSEYQDVKFHLKTWRQVTEYSANYAIYESEQDWLDEKEAARIKSVISGVFGIWSNKDIPLSELRKIHSILVECGAVKTEK